MQGPEDPPPPTHPRVPVSRAQNPTPYEFRQTHLCGREFMRNKKIFYQIVSTPTTTTTQTVAYPLWYGGSSTTVCFCPGSIRAAGNTNTVSTVSTVSHPDIKDSTLDSRCSAFGSRRVFRSNAHRLSVSNIMNCVPAYGKTRIIVALHAGGVTSIGGVQCLMHDVPGTIVPTNGPTQETTRMTFKDTTVDRRESR